MTHKTYLVLGSSPKFHIESLGGTFFGRTRTFGIFMLNALRGTFLPPSVSLLWSHACEWTASFLSFFWVPSRVALKCGFLFWKVPKSIDDKGSWVFKDGWLDWVQVSAAYWGCYMNQFVCKSHKSPQGKNAIPSKQLCGFFFILFYFIFFNFFLKKAVHRLK